MLAVWVDIFTTVYLKRDILIMWDKVGFLCPLPPFLLSFLLPHSLPFI